MSDGQEYHQLKTRCAEQEQHIKSLLAGLLPFSDMRQAQSVIDQQKSTIASLQAENSVLKGQLDGANTRIKTLSDSVDTLSKQLDVVNVPKADAPVAQSDMNATASQNDGIGANAEAGAPQ